jgi:hypothetical protein
MRESMPTTRYSQLIRAVGMESPARDTALLEMLESYQPPLAAYVAWRFSLDGADAEEILRAFTFDKVVSQRLVEQFLDGNRESFRGYLTVALRRYVIDVLRRRKLGREIEERVAREEQIDQEISSVLTLEWLRELLENVLRHVRDECRADGRERDWNVFFRRCLAPILLSTKPPDYATLANDFGFQTSKEVANRIETMKRRFDATVRRMLAEELRTDDLDAIEDEMREVRRQAALATTLNLPAVVLRFDRPDAERGTPLPSSSATGLSNMLDLTAQTASNLTDTELGVLYEVYLSTPIRSLFASLTSSGQQADDATVTNTETIGQLLQQPQPARAQLVQLKELASTVLKRHRPIVPLPIALVFRFASICLARTRLREDLSSLPADVLRDGLQRVLKYPWLDEATRTLFTKTLHDLTP